MYRVAYWNTYCCENGESEAVFLNFPKSVIIIRELASKCVHINWAVSLKIARSGLAGIGSILVITQLRGHGSGHVNQEYSSRELLL